MHVIEVPNLAGPIPLLIGPFASTLEAKEYMLDAYQDPNVGRVLVVQPPDPSMFPEPGL